MTPAERSQKWRDLNRIKFREYQREYQKQWRLRNLEKVKARVNKWRKLNPEKASECCRRWRKSNPHKRSNYEAVRRSKCKVISRFDKMIIESVYTRCQELRQWFDVVVDHIVPLAKGGLHEPSNLQIIYRNDNERKGTTLNHKPRIIFE